MHSWYFREENLMCEYWFTVISIYDIGYSSFLDHINSNLIFNVDLTSFFSLLSLLPLNFTNFYDPKPFHPFFSIILLFLSPSSVPPDIINEESSTDIAVQEGEDATLVCKATGHPPPRVVWRREDGENILMKKSGISGKELIRCKYKNLLNTPSN